MGCRGLYMIHGIPQARTDEIMGETVLFSLLTPMLIELGRGLR